MLQRETEKYSDQEAEEHQEEESADTAAVNHGGCEERDVRLRNSSNFKRVADPGRGAGEEYRGAQQGER
ncbi:hypothetical protein PBY51_021498 [Eleginops maclovinus]|uniref:Uncharacterized protein n=1 Tax=Eleginops maclovinus TaxID=56733 RepID=A0AAN7XFZ6_ELEMC|nr:hypothetical protein PBY51_021498 [Eleginops maclovinus]